MTHLHCNVDSMVRRAIAPPVHPARSSRASSQCQCPAPETYQRYEYLITNRCTQESATSSHNMHWQDLPPPPPSYLPATPCLQAVVACAILDSLPLDNQV